MTMSEKVPDITLAWDGKFTENKGAGIVVHLADEHLIYEKVGSILTFVLLLFANF